MVKLNIGRKNGAVAAPPAASAAPTAEMAAPAPEEAPAPPPRLAPAPAPQYQAAATYEPPPVTEDIPPTYQPPPYSQPGMTSPRGAQGGIAGWLQDVGEVTPADRDRQAAADWERVIAPVMEMMRASVPDANSPEDAARILAENQGEITPDPKGGSYIFGDAFDRDARVYYRLLRRDYEKVPRPSEVGKRAKSHHLHELYGKLTGVKGW